MLFIDPYSITQLQFCTSHKLMGPWTVLKWCRCDSHQNVCLPPGVQQTQSDQSKTSQLQATLLVTETSLCVHTCMKERQYFCPFCCSLLLPFVIRLLGAIAAAHCYRCYRLSGAVQQLLKLYIYFLIDICKIMVINMWQTADKWQEREIEILPLQMKWNNNKDVQRPLFSQPCFTLGRCYFKRLITWLPVKVG